jgi:enoyl-CoA hydratase
MNYNTLTLNFDGRIAIVTLNREKNLNAINQEMMRELGQFFRADALQLDGLRGVVLTGAGEKAFVAGADIKEFDDLDRRKAEKLSQFGHDVFKAIERFQKPVIAAVNGFALGGGLELAMAAHIRTASDNAQFGLPEATLGIIPGYGGTQRLVQLIGKGRAIELMMTTQRINAQKALDWGLVTHVVPQADLMNHTLTLLNGILDKAAPLSLTKIIECVNDFYEPSVNGFFREVLDFGELAQSEDFKEGAQAFVEKRKAVFKGK